MTNRSTTIWHIDDDELLLAVFEFVLKEAGFEVISAGSGAEALQLAGAVAAPPGLVVLDLDMPKMTGVETLGHLRQLPRFKTVPVVVMSARSANDEQVLAALNAGATGYVSKAHLNLKQLPDKMRGYVQVEQQV